ncbi:MAG: SUMF1/EgtB/PvdO family nonheme iron enzyme [Kiritimatiellae bacterium]|nr:SUMF1/EgtB/PvdO family nonheme iron enzyme [Kiritimatiellia bacterium]
MVAALAAMGAGAAPVVEITSVQQQYPWTNTVDITYTSTGIAEENTYYVVFKAQNSAGTEIGVITNDLKISQGSTWVARWQPPFNVRYENCTMTPYVYRGGQDDYMIVDLETWQVTFDGMSTQEASNTRYNTDDYKTKKLVFRKIEPGTYQLGVSDNSLTQGQTNSIHNVTFSKAYYMAIFETTESQFMRLNGESVTTESAVAKGSVSWNTIRGSAGVSAAPGAGVLNTLNTKTGRKGFDLPTESMWEVAARADNTDTYISGETSTEAVLDYCWTGDNSDAYQVVGGKLPNAWGLYDFGGNVWEWMRDMYNTEDLAKLQTDIFKPISSGDATKVAYRGNGRNNKYTSHPKNWSYSYRPSGGPLSSEYVSTGFRIAYIPE